MTNNSDKRSRKDLQCTKDATGFQREFVSQLKQRVVEQGEPFVVAQADTPHELFHVMDILLISNQWWAAYISAKQLSTHYFKVLDEQGYPGNTCRYCSLGFACTLDNDPATAPWGGLPKPIALVARLTCDSLQHVFGQWARALDTDFFPFEAPAWTYHDTNWFENSNEYWEEVYQSHRIELMIAEMRELIALLERKSGRRFSEAKLMKLMERINEQETYLAEAASMIGSARPCPVSITDQMPNAMIPQWHRGSDWAVAHARRFRDEVAERVKAGVGVSTNERIRLMWIGAGLWHDPGFYNSLEERYGAVFVWSMYLPFSRVQYIRDIKNKPFHALASRICSMNEVLHLPPWMNRWMISEARRCGIDAAVILMPPDNRCSQSGIKLTRLSLEEAGLPTLLLDADMVDAKEWDHEQMVDYVSEFLGKAGLT